MFNPLTIPFGAKMLFNVVKLKPGYTLEDADLAGTPTVTVEIYTADSSQDRFLAMPASSAMRDRSAVPIREAMGCWQVV